MGFGKMLGLAALGVGAVAAAPFTGGGSILGAATLGASLAGAGTVAAAVGAGAAGAAAGYAMSRKEEEEESKKNEALAKLKKELEKAKDVLNKFHGDAEYFNFIISATAIGLAAANADGSITEDESEEIKQFIGGMAESEYPKHVKDTLLKLEQTPPSIGTAIKYLESVPPESIKSIEELIEIVIMADGYRDDSEEKFLIVFQELVKDVVYVKDSNNEDSSKYLDEAKNNINYFLNNKVV